MTKKRTKGNGIDVFVGVPVFGDSCNNTFRNCLDYALGELNSSGRNFRRAFESSPNLSANRNRLVQAGLDIGAKWIIMVDSDMVFPKDSFKRLLSHNKTIISALYFKKVPPFRPICRIEKDGIWRDFEPDYIGGLHKVSGFGFGMVAVKASAFKKIPKPWFAEPPECLSHDGEKFVVEENQDTILTTPEDMWFCHLAKAVGFDLWLDASISLGHLGIYPFSQEEYFANMPEEKPVEEKEPEKKMISVV